MNIYIAPSQLRSLSKVFHIKMYSWFSLFVVVMFHKVTTNIKLTTTEPLILVVQCVCVCVCVCTVVGKTRFTLLSM